MMHKKFNKCQFQERIIDYIEGLLDAQHKSIFEVHLKECDVCQKELSAIKKIYGMMDNDKVIIPAEEIFAKMKNRVRQHEIVLKRPLWKIWSILIPVLGVLIFVLLFNRQKEQSLEISVPISSLSQDKYFNTLLLERIVDNNIVNQFNILEEYFTEDIEQGLKDLTTDEQQKFIEAISEKYGEKYL